MGVNEAIEKIDDPELRKIAKEIYGSTDDEEEALRLFLQKLDELSEKKRDPYAPFIPIRRLLGLILFLIIFSSTLLYFGYQQTIIDPTDFTGYGMILLALGLPLFLIIGLTHSYINYRRKTY